MNKVNQLPAKLALLIPIFLLTGFIYAQDEEPPSRSITSADFQSKREPAEGGNINKKSSNIRQKKSLSVITNPNRRYRLIKRQELKVKKRIKKIAVKNKIPEVKVEQLGVTFWRLRPLSEDDFEVPEVTVRINNKIEKWTAERVASTTKFKNNDRIRFSIETSRSGYLYIVNREFYTDGTKGEANIIFPTLRSRSGDNRVKAGNLIEIPSAEDSVSYFTIQPKRADYAGEEIIVLILPDQLPNFQIGLRAQKLNDEILQNWFADWESVVDIYDAEDGEGITYTAVEEQKAKVATRSLTQEDPLPQTIYKALLSETTPFFVAFQIQAKQ